MLKMKRALVVRAALSLLVTSALPLRAPARGSILSTCNKGCPEEGGSRLGLTGFSEAMAIMFNDCSSSKSDESASTFARTGENGLDRAASKVFATSVAATTARLQLYKNHASAEVALAAPDARALERWTKCSAVPRPSTRTLAHGILPASRP